MDVSAAMLLWFFVCLFALLCALCLCVNMWLNNIVKSFGSLDMKVHSFIIFLLVFSDTQNL